MFHALFEYSLERGQEMTQGKLKYGSASVEGMITGWFEWGALNNDWHGKKHKGNNFQFIHIKFEGDFSNVSTCYIAVELFAAGYRTY